MSNEKNTAAYDPRYFNADGTPVTAETNVEFVNRIMAEQAKIDATDDAMADDIVEMQAPTLSTPHASGSPVAAFVQFAKSWIKTAARYARNADFWRAKAEAKEATSAIVAAETKMRALWQLLDDIDTEDDFCKDLDAVYRVRTRAIQKKRWAIWTPEPEGEPVTLLRSDASQPLTEHDNLTGNGDGPLVMKVTPPTIDSDVINPFDGKAFPLEPAGDIALGSGPVLIKGVAHERLAGEDDEALRRRLSEPEGKVQS